MKKIIIVGNSPLPFEEVNSRPAAGLRTWQFYKATKERFANKVEIHLVCIAMPECYTSNFEKLEKLGVNYIYRLNKNEKNLKKRIRKIVSEVKPNAIVTTNTFPSSIVCTLNIDTPIWSDLNGWIMAEAQAEAFSKKNNAFLSHYWSLEKNVIKRADKISTVSKAQMHAVYGELAGQGRLNLETFNEKFVFHIPNLREKNTRKSNNNYKEELENRFQELKKIPIEGVKAFWLGGYNNWADIKTLFRGLEKGMEENSNLYFISTGGKISGISEGNFAHFKDLIKKSRFRDRFIFLGWVDIKEIDKLLKYVDFGINVDLDCPETTFGARNRLNELISYEVPVISSLGSEVAQEINDNGAGYTFKSGSVEEFSEKLDEMCNLHKKGELKSKFGSGIESFNREFSDLNKWHEDLFQWLEKPERSGDAFLKIKVDKKISLRGGFLYLKENGFRKFFRKLWQKFF